MFIQEMNQSEIDDNAFNSIFDLWWSNFEEAGIKRLFVAFTDEEKVIGFQTVNGDGQCVAIEVVASAQGHGVGRALVEESNCWKPERNECSEFWAKMAKEFG